MMIKLKKKLKPDLILIGTTDRITKLSKGWLNVDLHYWFWNLFIMSDTILTCTTW